MKNRRAKLAAGATVLGLGALGGVALGTNPGTPVTGQGNQAGPAARVVTSASGAAAVPVSQPAVAPSPAEPIVTRASGGRAPGPAAFDD